MVSRASASSLARARSSTVARSPTAAADKATVRPHGVDGCSNERILSSEVKRWSAGSMLKSDSTPPLMRFCASQNET